jgi:hypothetical protein
MLFERLLFSFFIIILTLNAFANSLNQVKISAKKNLSFYDWQVAEHLLKDSVLFYNSELRNPTSGQYYDAVSLLPGANPETNSSSAATGMGLISLALGDATGLVKDADIKSVQTLAAVLNPEFSKRHQKGWFRHWFNAADGADNSWSRADGYSTIDTAILAAGAILASRYFSSQGKDVLGVMQQLSDNLLSSVQWSSAIADANAGRLYLNFDLATGAAQGSTAKFNEYILVSCMGKLAEKKQGLIDGPMTRFWKAHYSTTGGLPKRNFSASSQSIPLLTDHPLHYLSSFTIQFAYYLCSDVNSNSEYVHYFKNAQLADQLWFNLQMGSRVHYWGNGAGEALNSTYAANSITNNKDLIVSPHIIAGFLAEAPQNVSDLVALYNDKTCLYEKSGFEFLWRCSLSQPSQRLNRLQAIDFSTMFLGLSTLDPRIGKSFYQYSELGTNQ